MMPRRKQPRKECLHTAKADILESLDELRWRAWHCECTSSTNTSVSSSAAQRLQAYWAMIDVGMESLRPAACAWYGLMLAGKRRKSMVWAAT